MFGSVGASLEIFVADADGNINSKPAWSLDGKTIFFHRMVPPDYRFRIFKINPFARENRKWVYVDGVVKN